MLALNDLKNENKKLKKLIPMFAVIVNFGCTRLVSIPIYSVVPDELRRPEPKKNWITIHAIENCHTILLAFSFVTTTKNHLIETQPASLTWAYEIGMFDIVCD